MKKKVLQLIEEIAENTPEAEEGITKLTSDPDIDKKLSTTINIIQNELARMKKLPARTTVEMKAGEDYDLKEIEDFYQLSIIRCKDENGKSVRYDLFGTLVTPEADGTATVNYYKYPVQIDETTQDEYVFELSTDALEIMPLGVAGMVLMSDVSNSYGRIYSDKYEQMIQRLDPRYAESSIYIEGGVRL